MAYITTIVKYLNSCRFFHRWEFIFGGTINEYFECKDCGDRKVYSSDNIYQPIDWCWLERGR